MVKNDRETPVNPWLAGSYVVRKIRMKFASDAFPENDESYKIDSIFDV